MTGGLGLLAAIATGVIVWLIWEYFPVTHSPATLEEEPAE